MIKINKTTPGNHKYLTPLLDISKPPEYIFFTGTLPEKRRPSVAIVGTRKPTAYGREVAHRLAYELAKQGVVIISGLALGIDSIAHRAALEAGGTTLAVLANSVDHIYPRSHAALARQINEQGGAVLSEYEPPTPARGFQFLARNRLVSGLADAVVVVEAASRSGTLSTAAHALEQGRDVFAVPGNITSPLSNGCNALLKQGANPVTSSDDILARVMPQTHTQTALPLPATAAERVLMELLQAGIRDGDELQRRSGLEPDEFGHTLTMMELGGTVRALGANQWSL